MDEVMSMGNELIGKVGDNSSIFLAGTYRPSMAVLIVTFVVGLLICLFGLKLMRLLAAIVGFVRGAVAQDWYIFAGIVLWIWRVHGSDQSIIYDNVYYMHWDCSCIGSAVCSLHRAHRCCRYRNIRRPLRGHGGSIIDRHGEE